MTHHFGSDFHQLLSQSGQGPVADFPGQGQPTQEVPQIIGQGEQLQPNVVIHEIMTGKPPSVHLWQQDLQEKCSTGRNLAKILISFWNLKACLRSQPFDMGNVDLIHLMAFFERSKCLLKETK